MALVPFTVYLNDGDLDVALALMQALGISTPDSLLKVALWNQAKLSLDDVPKDVFVLSWGPARVPKAGRRRRAAPDPPGDPESSLAAAAEPAPPEGLDLPPPAEAPSSTPRSGSRPR